MTPFEAYILIQQGTPPSKTTLEEALKSLRLNPNGTFKGDSLLSSAIKRNAPHILRLFLDYGGSPDLKSYENGRYEPAIITAVRHKSLSCVQILVDYGGDVEKTNFYGADAIFQAVYENAFSILEYLLVEVCGQRGRRGKPIVIQKVTKEEEGGGVGFGSRTCSATVLNIKESSYYIENDYYDHDHWLCPLYYALDKAQSYPAKEKSLVRLLQFNYGCKCMRLVASCCSCSGGDDEEVKKKEEEEMKVAILECLGALDSFLEGVFYEESRKEKADAFSFSIDQDQDQGLVEQQQHDHYNENENENEPTAIFPSVDDDDHYGKMKFGRKKLKLLCAYRILRMEDRNKCHAIKENECSSSSSSSSSGIGTSYLVLVGPLTLSSMAREVIRNQIMPLCTCTSRRTRRNKNIASSSSSLSPPPPPPAVCNHYGGRGEEAKFGVRCGKGNFRKCLETLNLPPSILDFMVYGKTRRSVESGRSHIKLIKKDLMLNVNYFAFYIL